LHRASPLHNFGVEIKIFLIPLFSQASSLFNFELFENKTFLIPLFHEASPALQIWVFED
jgi:hypothetical protein